MINNLLIKDLINDTIAVAGCGVFLWGIFVAFGVAWVAIIGGAVLVAVAISLNKRAALNVTKQTIRAAEQSSRESEKSPSTD